MNRLASRWKPWKADDCNIIIAQKNLLTKLNRTMLRLTGGDAARSMPTVAQIVGSIRIEQRFGEHHPPHFHAIQGKDEVGIEIALPLNVISGGLKPGALQDVREWAKEHRAELALNWVDALAQAKPQRIL